MRPWLPELSLFDDATPHSASLNMAIDEALLGIAAGPLLRIYRWERPAVSFGCFQRWTPVRDAHGGRDSVRRWTGGGVVLHGADVTYSLLIPRSLDEARLAPGVSYSLIHRALCLALEDAGHRAAPAEADAAKVSNACFENPVQHDVIAGGRKVAGAAQRRAPKGLIHQGSIQGLDLSHAFGDIFAGYLSTSVHACKPDAMGPARILEAEKYGTREWLEKFP